MSIAKSDGERQQRRRSGNVDGTLCSVSEPPSLSDSPNPRSWEMSIAKSDAERQQRRRRRSGNDDGTLRSVSEPPSLSDSPSPRSWGRQSRKGWLKQGRKEKLSREDWLKLGRKEKEYWRYYLGSLSLEGRGEAQLLIKQEAVQKEAIKQQKEEAIKQEKKAIKQQKKATKQQKKAEQLLIRKTEQLLIREASVSTDTPNTIKEELSASPSSEMVVSSSEITTTHPPLFNMPFEYGKAYPIPVYTCQICGAADHSSFRCSYMKEIPPDFNIFNQVVYHIICIPCGEGIVNGACPYNCLPPAPRRAAVKPLSGIFKKDETSAASEDGIRPIHPAGIPRAAILAGRSCQICGSPFHMALQCSYLLESPPDAEIIDESRFEIACKRCYTPIVNGACPEKCLPPLRTMVTPKVPANIFPRKKLSAPTSSQTVVHSSSEERFKPRRFGSQAACESNNSTICFH